jgi:hypothetical protein
MKNSKTYTLAELAEDFGLTERTARYWIEKILPAHHKQGRGKLARYGQDTWNCFAFIQLAGKRYSLRPGQVAEVLTEVSQATIDRVVTGEEELKVMAVPTDEPYMRAMRRASARAQQHRSLRELLTEEEELTESEDSEYLKIPSFLRIDESIKPSKPAGKGYWREVHADDRVHIECRYAGKLTMRQHEQIRAAARLIRLALE